MLNEPLDNIKCRTCNWCTLLCLTCSSIVGSCQWPSINTGDAGFMVDWYVPGFSSSRRRPDKHKRMQNMNSCDTFYWNPSMRPTQRGDLKSEEVLYERTRQIWGIWKLRPAYSPETPNLGQNRWCFVPCDLEIWWMTLENNRASLLCCFKLCATFHSHRWIQTGVTVRKRPIWVKFDDF